MQSSLERPKIRHLAPPDSVPVKQNFERKILIIFLRINLNIRFGCSKEPSH